MPSGRNSFLKRFLIQTRRTIPDLYNPDLLNKILRNSIIALYRSEGLFQMTLSKPAVFPLLLETTFRTEIAQPSKDIIILFCKE